MATKAPGEQSEHGMVPSEGKEDTDLYRSMDAIYLDPDHTPWRWCNRIDGHGLVRNDLTTYGELGKATEEGALVLERRTEEVKLPLAFAREAKKRKLE